MLFQQHLNTIDYFNSNNTTEVQSDIILLAKTFNRLWLTKFKYYFNSRYVLASEILQISDYWQWYLNTKCD